MTRRRKIVLLTAIACAGLALGVARAGDVPKVATGFVAGILCSETFVSGLDPRRTFTETNDAMPGTGLISWAMDYRIDRVRKDVTVTLFGSAAAMPSIASGSAARSRMASRLPKSYRRRTTGSPRCFQRSPAPRSCRRKVPSLLPRSTAPLPSRCSRPIAAPAQSSW